MKKIFLLVLCMGFLLSTTVRADLGAAMNEIQLYFNTKGIVIDKGHIDLGTAQKMLHGTVLHIFGEGEDVVHPVTGKILGKKQGEKGIVTIKKVYTDYSEVSFSVGYTPNAKDEVGFGLPVGVEVVLDGQSSDEKKMVENLLEGSATLKEGNDYIITLQKIAGGTNYKIAQKNKTVLLTGFSPNNTSKLITIEKFKETSGARFMSVALGKIYKNKADKFLVVATDTSIFVYDSKTLEKTQEIKGKYNLINSVEVADLNNDGIDEIFINNTIRGNSAKSIILQHNGKDFVIIKKDIEYLFRSVLKDGKRYLYAQKVSKDGGYRGEIFEYIYTTDYATRKAVKHSAGKGVLSFGMYEEDGKQYLLAIDSAGRFSAELNGKRILRSASYYGDTINTIDYSHTVSGNKDDDDAMSLTTNASIQSRPRMEVLSNGKVLLVENALMSRAFANSLVFNKSTVGVYAVKLGVMQQEQISNDLEPLITDIFVHEIGDDIYIYAVKSSNNWLLQKAKSELLLMKVGE